MPVNDAGADAGAVPPERAVAESPYHGSELFAAITGALLDAVTVWSAVRDDAGKIVDLRYEFVNASSERLIGWTSEQLLGQHLLEIAPVRRAQFGFEMCREVIETGISKMFEIAWGRRDDVERVVEASVVRFGDGVVVASREITAHKQIEEQLRASEHRYRLLTDFAADGAVQTRQGTIEWVSSSTTANFGWEADDLIGRDVLEFFHPDDLDRARVNRTDAAAGLVGARIRARIRCKDGRWNWVDYRYRPLPGIDPALWAGITILWNVQAEVDALEALASTEREREELKERLVQAQKLEALGQLTGGVAHDFNNLLTVIVGGAEMLRDAHAGDAEVTALTSIVLGAAQRGADLTRRLLAFARRQTLRPSIVDPAEVIDAMSDLLRTAVGEHVSLVVARDTPDESDESDESDEFDEFDEFDEPSMVSIDRGQFEATLMNLAINARDAMPDGGTLTFRSTIVHLDAATAREHGDLSPGAYVRVSVADTGTGMSPGVLQHAFDPFFTTKDVSRGNGLGLSTVYGFIKQSGGHVMITSCEGSGTVVEMYIPRSGPSRQGSAVGTATTTAGSARGHGETVLVVEDDEQVRGLSVHLLEDLGYSVIEATAGAAALDVLRTDVPIDLVFTDVVMPGGMTGQQLAAFARGVRPGVPLLFTSGYTDNADLHRDGPHVEVLTKPYLRAELAAAVRRALDPPAPERRGDGQ